MAAVSITGRQGWSSCDDCGSYDWEAFTVSVHGKPVLEHTGDGHLGGGGWYAWEDAVREILTAMGHDVVIDIEYMGETNPPSAKPSE